MFLLQKRVFFQILFYRRRLFTKMKIRRPLQVW